MRTGADTRAKDMRPGNVARGRTYDMAYIGIFAVVIAVCSWISIPAAVPFTLQTFAVFLAVILLGGKRGTMAVLVYILLGAMGIPVFAGFRGGIGVLFNNTGGYIVGFLCSTLIMWAAESLPGRKLYVQAVSMMDPALLTPLPASRPPMPTAFRWLFLPVRSIPSRSVRMLSKKWISLVSLVLVSNTISW